MGNEVNILYRKVQDVQAKISELYDQCFEA